MTSRPGPGPEGPAASKVGYGIRGPLGETPFRIDRLVSGRGGDTRRLLARGDKNKLQSVT